ncbi:WhiB family transcriptional regulator [Streptomyces chromofuscus]
MRPPPAREACADYAIDNGLPDGIYGGLTVDERDLRPSRTAGHVVTEAQ